MRLETVFDIRYSTGPVLTVLLHYRVYISILWNTGQKYDTLQVRTNFGKEELAFIVKKIPLRHLTCLFGDQQNLSSLHTWVTCFIRRLPKGQTCEQKSKRGLVGLQIRQRQKAYFSPRVWKQHFPSRSRKNVSQKLRVNVERSSTQLWLEAGGVSKPSSSFRYHSWKNLCPINCAARSKLVIFDWEPLVTSWDKSDYKAGFRSGPNSKMNRADTSATHSTTATGRPSLLSGDRKGGEGKRIK